MEVDLFWFGFVWQPVEPNKYQQILEANIPESDVPEAEKGLDISQVNQTS